MTTAILTAAEFASYTERLRDRFMPAVNRALKPTAQAARLILAQETDKAKAVNTGDFKRRWYSEVGENCVHIYNTARHAGVIELGRRSMSRMPPRMAIARWAQRRLGLGEAEAMKAAYGIGLAIARRGLQPRKVMGNAIPRIRDIARTEIARAIVSLVREV